MLFMELYNIWHQYMASAKTYIIIYNQCFALYSVAQLSTVVLFGLIFESTATGKFECRQNCFYRWGKRKFAYNLMFKSYKYIFTDCPRNSGYNNIFYIVLLYYVVQAYFHIFQFWLFSRAPGQGGHISGLFLQGPLLVWWYHNCDTYSVGHRCLMTFM